MVSEPGSGMIYLGPTGGQRRDPALLQAIARADEAALHLAHAGMLGIVTVVDDRGMAIIQTEDGQEYQVQATDLQVGDQVTMDNQGMVTIPS